MPVDHQRTYTISEVAALFGVHPSTLRRWRNQLEIQPQQDASHLARRIYSESQVLALAQAHRRVTVLSAELREAALADMDRRVRELEARLAEMEERDRR